MIIKTRYSINAHGNLDASTLLLPDNNGQQWEITTCKRYNGRLLSTLSKVKVSKYGVESDWDAQIESIVHEVKRVTMQALKTAHLNAVKEFMDFLKMEVKA